MNLRFDVQTPNERVLSAIATSVRIPTPSGHVGLRPRQEPYATVVEPGLIVVHDGAHPRFVASAGGLLSAAGDVAILFTSFAVAGASEAEVEAALDDAQRSQNEIIAHRKLGELEQRIIRNIRQSGAAAPRGQ